MEIIFSKNKWRYTAYLNALLELPYRRRMCIPGAMDLGWERFKWVPLPGGVKMAVRKERKNALTAGEQSQGRNNKPLNPIIGPQRKIVK